MLQLPPAQGMKSAISFIDILLLSDINISKSLSSHFVSELVKENEADIAINYLLGHRRINNDKLESMSVAAKFLSPVSHLYTVLPKLSFVDDPIIVRILQWCLIHGNENHIIKCIQLCIENGLFLFKQKSSLSTSSNNKIVF